MSSTVARSTGERARSARTADDASASPTASAYRPHLDGLRAVAVYLVVAFHAGITQLSGGFIGVDVFFVLSGYLVTQLLMRDISRIGRIRLSNFYARRVRRLLPAALVTLVVTSIVFGAIAAPSEFPSALNGIRAACLYVANWFFIRQSSNYFAADITASPVMHFWSLAIEEQFYLVWPLMLFGLFSATKRLGARQWNAIRVAVFGLASASLFAALIVSRSNLNRAYYGTDTRAYQLLAGALLAISAERLAADDRVRRWAGRLATVGFVAILALATSLIHLGPIQRGLTVTLATGAVLFGLDHGERGLVQRGLSRPTTSFLGRISYGTYLWHWLIIVVAVREFHSGPWTLFLLSATLATSIASLSYQVLERPVRISAFLDRYRAPVVALGLTMSVIWAFVIAPIFLDTSHTSRVDAAAQLSGEGTPVPANVDWQAVAPVAFSPDCLNQSPQACVVVRGTGKTVVLIGDSHARMLMPPLAAMARLHNWTLAVLIVDACPWQDGLYRFTGFVRDTCLAHKADWENRVIPALNPDIVVLMAAPLDHEGVKGLHLAGPTGPLQTGSAAAETEIERETDKTVARYRRAGRDVVLIEPIPQAPQGYDPLACLSKAKYLEQCRFVANVQPSALELHYRKLASSDSHIWSIDIDRLACPYFPICDPFLNNTVVWFDLSHLSAQWVRRLADPLNRTFVDNRIGAR